MAPVEILTENIFGRPPEVLRTEGEKPLVITTYPPAPIELKSINADRTGELRVTGRTKVVTVKKHTSERDKEGTEMDLTSHITFSGPEFLIVNSPLYGETMRISHKPRTYSFYGNPQPPVNA